MGIAVIMAQADGQLSSARQDIDFTPQALHNIELRGIDRSDVVKALREDTGQRIDETTGHLVSKMGDVRIVSRREGDRLVVMTAIRRDEFPDDAG